MLDDWLHCVKEGRKGDIMCVYLLSIATGVHTMVHLKNNKIWSTLYEIPHLHSEMVEHCEKHLVYLGFGIFLHLVKRPTITPNALPILGTVSSDNPATQQELLLSIGMEIKPETEITGTTPIRKSTRAPKASAAAGSAAQLERVEAKMKQEPPINKPEAKLVCHIQPMVKLHPFEVCIIRLTPKEIEKHTKRSHELLPHSQTTTRSSPVTTRSMTRRRKYKGQKHRITGHPSQLVTPHANVQSEKTHSMEM